MRAFLLEDQVAKMAPVGAGYAADGRQYSLLEYLLWETEQMHGRIRRYTSPDEHAFFPRDLPPLVLPPIQYLEASHTVLLPIILQHIDRDAGSSSVSLRSWLVLHNCP